MVMKMFVGSVAVIVAGTGAIVLDSNGVGGIPPQWIIGILVTVLIAVLTAMGALIKIAYDTAMKWETVLQGDADLNGDLGFIHRSEERHAELRESYQQVDEQLLIQGRLLSELAFAYSDIAKELESSEDVDVSVNLDHIDRLRKQKDERRKENE